ncbi:hypothetical protein JG688_00014860, partial [Phytophthora aleatoria]
RQQIDKKWWGLLQHCIFSVARAVPVIHGFRVPATGADSSQEKLCKRAVLSLVLFQRFRHLNDLIAFMTWKGTCSKFVETILDNMDDFYSGVDRSKCQSDEKINPGVAPGVSGPENDSADEDDNLFHGENFDMDEGDILVEDCTMDENLRCAWDFEADENTILDISALDPASCPTWSSSDLKTVSMLDLFSRHDILQNAAEKTVRIGTSTGMLVDNLPTIEKWVRAEESDNSILSTDTSTITAMDTQVIELLDTSLLGSSMEWHAPTAATFRRSPNLQQRFATISQTPRGYTSTKGNTTLSC